MPSTQATTELVWPAIFIKAFVALRRTRRRGSFNASLRTGTTFSACLGKLVYWACDRGNVGIISGNIGLYKDKGKEYGSTQ